MSKVANILMENEELSKSNYLLESENAQLLKKIRMLEKELKEYRTKGPLAQLIDFINIKKAKVY